MSISEHNISRSTSHAFTSASLRPVKPLVTIGRAYEEEAPGTRLDENGAQIKTKQEVPFELHEPNIAISPLEALHSRGPAWVLSMVRQIVLARLRLRNCDVVGRWVRVRGKVHVHNEGRIAVGDRVRFRSEAAVSELVAWKGGSIEIGEATTINYGTSISAASSVTIGRHCLIGTYVNIMDCNFHNLTDRTWNMDAEPIVIEDDVWLGNRSMIMKGVTVGRGSVVAACSLVTKDVPPNTLVLGVPARVVQHL